VQRQEIVQDFVQYSVDEFFGTLPSDNPDELRHYATLVKQMIAQSTYIPVSCGLSQTYTLAKVATHYAKHYKGYDGVCLLMPENRQRALSLLDIADVWGIGRQNRTKLYALGIHTAQELVNCDEKFLYSIFSVAGLNTWRELRGTPCIDLHRPAKQRSIMQSRTFVYMTDHLDDLEQYIRTFATACAAHLRQQHSVCRTVTVFLSTNRHRDDLAQYRNSGSVKLPSTTADTPTIIKAALAALQQLYRPGFLYKQAGVILNDISEEQGMQLDLFTDPQDERRRKLMQVADELNKRFGDDTISFGPLTHPSHDNPPDEE
jgi:DNA polymerase V